MDICINIPAVAEIVDALKGNPKSKSLKNAVKKIGKGKFVPGYVMIASNGKLVYATVFDHCEFTIDLTGVVISQFGMEIPFNNVDELIEAERTAQAIYYYRQSFADYPCTAGM